MRDTIQMSIVGKDKSAMSSLVLGLFISAYLLNYIELTDFSIMGL